MVREPGGGGERTLDLFVVKVLLTIVIVIKRIKEVSRMESFYNLLSELGRCKYDSNSLGPSLIKLGGLRRVQSI